MLFQKQIPYLNYIFTHISALTTNEIEDQITLANVEYVIPTMITGIIGSIK